MLYICMYTVGKREPTGINPAETKAMFGEGHYNLNAPRRAESKF
jgi:hypothetical protein